jgi:integrase/recombinase XerD
LKNKGHGRAKVLSIAEIKRLFTELEKVERDACLFAICFFTGCRISEALHLETTDIIEGVVTFRKSTTKGKLKTRTIPVHPALAIYLENYQPKKTGALFPGQVGRNKYLSRASADRILRSACERVGLVGVSTHSFRRSALSFMSADGVPLRVIQEVSGHSDLGTLQRYLEVTPEQLKKGIGSIWL